MKAHRGVGIIRFMSKYVSRDVLDQMNKLYVRPHLDYGDLIYHKDDPEASLSLTKRLESVQYTAALAVTGAWKGTNKSKLLDELGWEYLHDRRRYCRLTHFFKLLKGDAPEYMTTPTPQSEHLNYSLQEQNVFEPFATKPQGYYNSYYSYCFREWNKLDPSLRSIDSLSKFKAKLIKSLRPPKRSVFKISDIVSVRLLMRLRLGFSHLQEHKFRRNSSNSSRCICGDGDETTEHFLLRCSHFANTCSTLLEQVSNILKTDIMVLPEHRSVEILLYGDNNCNEIANKLITEATIVLIKLSKRFDT